MPVANRKQLILLSRLYCAHWRASSSRAFFSSAMQLAAKSGTALPSARHNGATSSVGNSWATAPQVLRTKITTAKGDRAALFVMVISFFATEDHWSVY